MPIYSYICTTCDFRIEKFQGIKDKTLHDCPLCGNIMRKDYQSMIPSRSMREYHGGVVDYDIDGTRKVFNTYEALKKAGKKAGLELV